MRRNQLLSAILLVLTAAVPTLAFQSASPLASRTAAFSTPTVGYLPSTTATSSRLSLSLKSPFDNKEKNVEPKGKSVVRVITRAAFALAALTLVQAPAVANAAETVEHLHTGQKVANFFMSFGLPKWAVLAIISAMPVVELRGAVPVGIWLGMPISKVLPICVLGNMTPIVPMMFLLRNEGLKKLMAPILSRAEKKASGLGVGSLKKQWVSLAAFVGIPLPGTGAWTGAMGAFLLNMPTGFALSSIFAGVVTAGIIMSTITLAGRTGGLAAIAVLLAVAGGELLSSKKEEVVPEAEEEEDSLEADE